MVSCANYNQVRLRASSNWKDDILCLDIDSNPEVDYKRNAHALKTLTESGKDFPSRGPRLHALSQALVDGRPVERIALGGRSRATSSTRFNGLLNKGRQPSSSSKLPSWTLSPKESLECAELWARTNDWKRLCDASVRIAKHLVRIEDVAQLSELEFALHLRKEDPAFAAKLSQEFREQLSNRLKGIESYWDPLRACLRSLAKVCSQSLEAATGAVSRGYGAALIEMLAMARKRPLAAASVAEAIASLMWVESNRQRLANNRQLILELCALLHRCRDQFNVDELSILLARLGRDPLEVFCRLDINRDGDLDSREIVQMLMGLDQALTYEKINEYISKMDKDGNGLISLRELCDFLRPARATIAKINKSLMRGQTPEAVFAHADTNKDGKLSRQEVYKMLRTQEPELSQGAMEMFFDTLDRDGNGSITLMELCETLGEQSAATRGCLRCFAGIAQAGERSTLMLIDLDILEDALHFSPADSVNADAGVCARLNELIACVLPNVRNLLKNPRKRSPFEQWCNDSNVLDVVAQGMLLHSKYPDVIGWGLSVFLTALGYAELKKEAKGICDRAFYGAPEFRELGEDPHIKQLTEAVQDAFNRKDYDF